jgi:hypothetical protein
MNLVVFSLVVYSNLQSKEKSIFGYIVTLHQLFCFFAGLLIMLLKLVEHVEHWNHDCSHNRTNKPR